MAQQLDTLIYELTQLTGIFTAELDLIYAALDLATGRVGDTRREFWVDQVSGDDANNGTQAAPLASLLEANSRSVWAGLTVVHIVGDYEMRERFSTRFHAIILIGDSSNFTFAAAAINSPANQPGFICNRLVMPDVSVVFVDFTIHLPADAAEEGIFINTGFVRLALRNVDITHDVGDSRIISSGSGAIGITTSGVTYPSSMAGRWVESVAAGEAPGPAKRVAYSSLSTL